MHEFTPQLALNDFNGHHQTIEAFVYSFSRCIGESPHRFFIDASAGHTDERGFTANSALLGVGLEWHPLAGHRAFAVEPVVRIGREDFRPGYGDTVYDAALTVSNVHSLQTVERDISYTNVDGSERTQRISVTTRQFEWAARVEYSNRDFSGPSSVAGSRGNEALTVFGLIGLDQEIGSQENGRTHWRWKGYLAYQTLPGPRAGFASLGLSFRIVNAHYTNYGWNFAVNGQLGDGGFRGIIFAISRRFAR